MTVGGNRRQENRSKTILKFDGSIGPTHEWTCIGWAYLIEFENGLAVRGFGHRFGDKSNVSVAEFEGLLHGLRRLQSLKRLHASLSTESQIAEGDASIIVQGDSQTVIDLLKQKESSNVGKGLRPFYAAAFRLLEGIGISWRAEKIPSSKNKECNGLAHAELEACLRESTVGRS